LVIVAIPFKYSKTANAKIKDGQQVNVAYVRLL